MGSGLSNVVAYDQAKNSSKHPEEFGKGCIDGVIAPEVANNASVGGTLIRFIALGIPGDGSTALLLGALTVQGVVTGPLMIRNYPTVVYMIYLSCLFAAVCVVLFEMAGMPSTSFLLAFVLGDLLETNMRRTLSYSENGWISLFTRPVSCVLILWRPS